MVRFLLGFLVGASVAAAYAKRQAQGAGANLSSDLSSDLSSSLAGNDGRVEQPLSAADTPAATWTRDDDQLGDAGSLSSSTAH